MGSENRSKKFELLAEVYDHAKHKGLFEFRIFTSCAGQMEARSCRSTVFFFSQKTENRINEAKEEKKRTVGYRRKKPSMKKGTQTMLTLLDIAKPRIISSSSITVFFSIAHTRH